MTEKNEKYSKYMPEYVFAKIMRSIKKEWIICFVSSLIFGLTAHIFKMTNWIPNWDSLLNYHNDQNTTYLGRCFLEIVCTISSFYDLPWVNTLLSVIYIGVSSAMISEIFGVKKKISLIMMSGLLVSFPTVAATFTYDYTADGYFMALLCACAGVLCVLRKKWGILCAAVLFAFSLGIYQSYITFAIILILWYLLDQLLFHETECRAFFNSVGRFLLSGVLGCVIYWVALKVILVVSGTSLSSYQGIASAFSGGNVSLFQAVKNCIKYYIFYFFDFSKGWNLFSFLNVLMFLFFIFAGILAVKERKLYREIWKLFFSAVCVLVLPFASYALCFISYLEYHSLMVMCHAMTYVFFVILYERNTDSGITVKVFRQWGIVGLSCGILYNFILADNICYTKLQMAYEESRSMIYRIADRLEQCEQSEKAEKLAIIGKMEGSGIVSVVLPPVMTGTTEDTIIWEQEQIVAMLRDYCGLSYEGVTEEEKEQILWKEEYQTMQAWPKESCAKMIDDILVLRLGE